MDLLTVPPPRDLVLRQVDSSSFLPEGERRVSFCAVQIRHYEQTVGDNPAVQYGPPISLDWPYHPTPALSLDDYEANREKRKPERQLLLSHQRRRDLLRYAWGASRADMEAAQQAADRVKRQRSRTRALLLFASLEEGCETAVAANRKRKTGNVVRAPSFSRRSHRKQRREFAAREA